MATHDLVTALWQEQSRWSVAADQMKRRIERSRSLALVIMVLVAVLGTGSATLGPVNSTLARVLAGLAAVGAAVIPILRPRWSGVALRDWTRTRSMSETLKSYVYLWLAGVETPGQDREAASLQNAINELRLNVVDLMPNVNETAPTDRPLPDVHDMPSYFEVRVAEQIDDFYRVRAQQLTHRLRAFDRASLVLALIGALLGGVAAATGSVGIAAWLPVATTVATALATHVAAARWRIQRLEYLRTAEQLSQLKSEAEGATTPGRMRELVLAAEATVTAENQAWMTKLTTDDPDPAGSAAG